MRITDAAALPSESLPDQVPGAMIHHHGALLQYDIVDPVLSYCLIAPYDPDRQPLEIESDGARHLVSVKAAWLATAARTCKAWHEPALRHLSRTLTFRDYPDPIPAHVIVGMGHGVRTLVINVRRQTIQPAIGFNHYTRLTTLAIFGKDYSWPSWGLSSMIRSTCPSLPNLTNLFLQTPWSVVVEFLCICRNLRRLGIDDHEIIDPTSMPVAQLEKLEELSIFAVAIGRPLVPLLATPLVTLNIAQPDVEWPYVDLRVLCEAIETSSRTLRAVSLSYRLRAHSQPDAGPALAKALASCKSLRFLQLGFAVIDSCRMEEPDLMALLAPLPIDLDPPFTIKMRILNAGSSVAFTSLLISR
jgi:hypothetical protein